MNKKCLKKTTSSILSILLVSNLIFPNSITNLSNVKAVEKQTQSQVERDKEILTQEPYKKLERNGWTATLENGKGVKLGENEVKKLFDGQTSTFPEMRDGNPFTLQIDLGSIQEVHGFSVDKRPAFNNEQQKDQTPQQWGLNGIMLGYEIKTSENGKDFTTLETGAFTKDDYKLQHKGDLYNVGETVYKKFKKPVTTQHIQIIQTSNYNIYSEQDFSSSEINLFTLNEVGKYRKKHAKILGLEKKQVTINEELEIESALKDFESLPMEVQTQLKDLKDKLSKYKNIVDDIKKSNTFVDTHKDVLEAPNASVSVEKLKNIIEEYNALSNEVKNLLNNETSALINLINKIKEEGTQDIPELNVTSEFQEKAKADEERKIQAWQGSNDALLKKNEEDITPEDKQDIQNALEFINRLSKEGQEKLAEQKMKLESFLEKINRDEIISKFQKDHNDVLNKTDEKVEISDEEKVDEALASLEKIENENPVVKTELAKYKEKLTKLKSKIETLNKTNTENTAPSDQPDGNTEAEKPGMQDSPTKPLTPETETQPGSSPEVKPSVPSENGSAKPQLETSNPSESEAQPQTPPESSGPAPKPESNQPGLNETPDKKENDNKIKELEKQIEEKTLQLESKKQELQALDQEIANAESGILEKQKELEKVKKLEQQSSELVKKINKIGQLTEELEELSKQATSEENNRKKSEIQKQLDELGDIEVLKTKDQEVQAQIVKPSKTIETEITTANSELQEKQTKQTQLTDAVTQLDKEINQLKQEIEKVKNPQGDSENGKKPETDKTKEEKIKQFKKLYETVLALDIDTVKASHKEVIQDALNDLEKHYKFSELSSIETKLKELYAKAQELEDELKYKDESRVYYNKHQNILNKQAKDITLSDKEAINQAKQEFEKLPLGVQNVIPDLKERIESFEAKIKSLEKKVDNTNSTKQTPTLVSTTQLNIVIGNNQTLVVKTSADLSTFKEVRVDGKVIDKTNYDLKEGSTIVTLKASYLNTLAEGTHKLEIVSNESNTYKAHTVTVLFTIQKPKQTVTHNPNWQQDLRKHNEFINKTQPKSSLPNTGYVSNHSILLASTLLTLVAYKLYKKED